MRHFPLLATLCLSLFFGCRPPVAEPPADGQSSADVSSQVSSTPLRIWIVAPISDEPILHRQWMAHSEQPIQIRSLSVPELLAEPRPNCDVMLYPARLIGELNQRNWIVKMPPVSEVQEEQSQESEPLTLPLAWKSQAEYAGRTMALSLGCAVPTFIASSSLDAALNRGGQAVTWPELLEALGVSLADRADIDLAAAGTVDRDALVDRFLAVLATVSNRDPAYGLLFDLQTMNPRLSEPEFLQAATILTALGAQAEGTAALLGDHTTAWKWASQHDQKALTIASPALIDNEAASIKTGRSLHMASAQGDQAAHLATSDSAVRQPGDKTQRPSVTAWNTGGGLLASLSSNCRQTNQAMAFLRWLQAAPTRTVLAPLVEGIESSAARDATESLSWTARQSMAPMLSSNSLALEPRLPAAEHYREALAEQLLELLTGRKTASVALAEADRRWREITAAAGANQRLEYEQSLGLRL